MKIEEDTKEFVGFMFILLTGVFILFWAMVLPIVWFDGHAKSNYLKQTMNIDIPWYEAACLEVNISQEPIGTK